MRDRLRFLLGLAILVGACSPRAAAPDGSAADLYTVREMTMGAPDLIAHDLRQQGLPCVRNFQCPGSACDDSGSCHQQSRVLVVSDAAGCRMMGAGGTAPYCSVTDALGDPHLGTTYDVLLIKPSAQGGYDQTGNYLSLSSSIRLVGARAAAGDPAPVELSPIQIQPGAGAIQIGIEDLHLTPTRSGEVDGIYCIGAGISLTVRWSEIDGAPKYALRSKQCGPVRLIGNNFHDNGTGVLVIGPTPTQPLVLVDNFVTRNPAASTGVGLEAPGALSFKNIAAAGSLIAFNTVWGNACPLGSNAACNLYCDAGQPGVAYSLIGDPGGGASGIAAACAVTDSVVPANYARAAGALDQTLVSPGFVSATDYHLLPISKAAANSKLRVSAPASLLYPYDVDFDPRPQPGGGGEAAGVDVGADQLVP